MQQFVCEVIFISGKWPFPKNSTNFTESEEDTLKEQVRSREKSETEHFITDTIRKRVGERIHSRLKEMCYFENLIGKDRRITEDEIDEE